ncbi:22649_t:CDS:1, partial [Gigaspora margarita]
KNTKEERISSSFFNPCTRSSAFFDNWAERNNNDYLAIKT